MMSYAGAIILVIGFLLLIKYLKVVEKSSKVITIAKQSIIIVRHSEISDMQKEKALQKNAKELLLLFLYIFTFSLLALAIPFALIWLMELLGLFSVQSVIETTLSWDFILGSLIISIIGIWFINRKNGKSSK
jgi:hypothetical protein